MLRLCRFNSIEAEHFTRQASMGFTKATEAMGGEGVAFYQGAWQDRARVIVPDGNDQRKLAGVAQKR